MRHPPEPQSPNLWAGLIVLHKKRSVVRVRENVPEMPLVGRPMAPAPPPSAVLWEGRGHSEGDGGEHCRTFCGARP